MHKSASQRVVGLPSSGPKDQICILLSDGRDTLVPTFGVYVDGCAPTATYWRYEMSVKNTQKQEESIERHAYVHGHRDVWDTNLAPIQDHRR